MELDLHLQSCPYCILLNEADRRFCLWFVFRYHAKYGSFVENKFTTRSLKDCLKINFSKGTPVSVVRIEWVMSTFMMETGYLSEMFVIKVI